MFRIRLKELREEKGMNQRELAAALNVSPGAIGMWESGAREPKNYDMLQQIARFFCVPVGYLLETDAEREYSSGYGWYPPEVLWDKINNDRAHFLHYFIEGDPDCIDEIERVWDISVDHPERASDDTFKRFIQENVRLVSFLPEDSVWQMRLYEKKDTTQTRVVQNMEQIDFSRYHQIPILGRISAGFPLYAEEHIEGYTLTDLNGGAEYFALRVTGDSMNAIGINDGYLIIVRRQEEVENGEVAVVMVGDDDATVKRFYQTDSTVTLLPQSTNPAHRPQIYDIRNTPVRVLGKVKKVEFLV